MCLSPNQDLDFHWHMSWSFIYSMIWGESWLFVLLILMELFDHHCHLFLFNYVYFNLSFVIKWKLFFFLFLTLCVIISFAQTHWTQIRTRHMALQIQDLTWDRYIMSILTHNNFVPGKIHMFHWNKIFPFYGCLQCCLINQIM